MKSEYIIISEYCIQSHIEPGFLAELENEGLIEIEIMDNERYLHISQLRNLEQYKRWYYDLSINVAGIDVIQNLLDRIEVMQDEMNRMKEQLKLID